MSRALGPFETAATVTNESSRFNVVVGLLLAGGPTPERLGEALAALQARHPLLAARIVRRGRRYAFETGGVPAIPLEVAPRPDGEAWLRVAEDELNRPTDAARGPLLRAAYLPAAGGGPGPCELVLSLHHAVADGASAGTVVRQLLALLDPAAPPLAAAEAALPPPSDRFFPPRHRGLRGVPSLAAYAVGQLGDEVAYRLRSRGGRKPPLPVEARCRIFSRTLSEEATAALVRASRRHRVTLIGAVNAAVLTAVHRHLYDARPVPLRYFTFPDLRPYLAPPAGSETLACYISMVRHTARVRPERGFWALARELTAQVAAGSRRGDKFDAARMAPALMRMIVRRRAMRMGASAVSYIGHVDLEPRGGPVELRDLHAWVSNIPLGPEYTAHARLFRRRLVWDFLYLDSDLDEARAETIADEALAALAREAAAEEER